MQVFQRHLYCPHTDSMLVALPAEPGALQGYDPSLAIVDELHVVTEEVYEAMRPPPGSATGPWRWRSRPPPLTPSR